MISPASVANLLLPAEAVALAGSTKDMTARAWLVAERLE